MIPRERLIAERRMLVGFLPQHVELPSETRRRIDYERMERLRDSGLHPVHIANLVGGTANGVIAATGPAARRRRRCRC